MLTNELHNVALELIELVRKFPENERRVKHFSKWTIREVIAHISGWNLQRIGELEDFLAGKDVEIIADYDVFNRQVIRQKRYYTWTQLIKEFEQSCNDLVSAFKSVPEIKADTRIWEDKDSTPRTWLQVDIEHLEGEHVATLKKYLGDGRGWLFQ